MTNARFTSSRKHFLLTLLLISFELQMHFNYQLITYYSIIFHCSFFHLILSFQLVCKPTESRGNDFYYFCILLNKVPALIPVLEPYHPSPTCITCFLGFKMGEIIVTTSPKIVDKLGYIIYTVHINTISF